MKRSIGYCTLLALALMLSGCGGQSQAHKRRHYAEVYLSGDHAYARSYDNNDSLVWYMLYVNNQPASTSSSGLSSTSSALGSSWRVVSAPATSNLQSTGSVVKSNDNGEPQEEVQSDTQVPADEVVTDETNVSDTSGGSNDTSNSGNSDGGSSDSGGGDAGGGGDGG